MAPDVKVEKFIDSAEWIFAKTYAKIAPHEYAVRGKSPHLKMSLFTLLRLSVSMGITKSIGVKHLHIIALKSINT